MEPKTLPFGFSDPPGHIEILHSTFFRCFGPFGFKDLGLRCFGFRAWGPEPSPEGPSAQIVRSKGPKSIL